MSTSKQWFTTADEALLSRLFREKADLCLQLYELNKLRYRVRQAQRIGPEIAADKTTVRACQKPTAAPGRSRHVS
jgi:hypothetical protein